MNPRVLDTTIASLMLDGNPAIDLYETDLDGSTLVISFQTVAEMRYGAMAAGWGARRRHDLEQFLRRFHIVEYSDELGTHWAEIMLDARRAGRRLEAGDAWIAATALLLAASLITHDLDFSAKSCPSITVVNHARPSV